MAGTALADEEESCLEPWHKAEVMAFTLLKEARHWAAHSTKCTGVKSVMQTSGAKTHSHCEPAEEPGLGCQETGRPEGLQWDSVIQVVCNLTSYRRQSGQRAI